MRDSARFSRDRRIRKRSDFLRVQSSGARVTTDHFVLLVAAGPDPSGPARLGLVVTRKIGGAVARNRIKRVCREAFRTWPDLLPPGTDLVVIARAPAKDVSLQLVRSEWGRVAHTLRRRAEGARAAAEKARLANRP
jgi:ribonuclease P protein component